MKVKFDVILDTETGLISVDSSDCTIEHSGSTYLRANHPEFHGTICCVDWVSLHTNKPPRYDSQYFINFNLYKKKEK